MNIRHHNAQQKTNQDLNKLEDGFSSDSEALLEQQADDILEANETQQQCKEEIRAKLDKPAQVTTKNYSLQPDIETGWTLRKQLPKPIPLLFQNQFIDSIVTKAQKLQCFKCRLVYLGPRYDTTLLAWHNKQFIFPYPHLTIPHFPKYSRREFCGQKKGIPLDTVIFDSHFQSGNLDAAFRISQTHYELFLRVDSNTRGHIQWFYFSAKNMKKQNKYRFSICNMGKQNTLFTRGCKPYFFSSKKCEKLGLGWHQSGEVIDYSQKKSISASSHEVQSNNYMLTFEYQPQFDEDYIQICYSIPYTFSRLNSFLQNFIQKEKKNYLKVLKLCNSLGGLEIPLLIIDDTAQTKDPSANKKCIIISGRAHPGESNGSYMMQGFIEFLCGNTKIAEQLRKKVIFKIIPMLNPDGVAIGNHRTGLSGKDFNRSFNDPNKQICPEVYYLKKLVTETKNEFGENLLMFLDFHGHSVKKNVFMYGPQFPVNNKYYYETRIFPKMLGELTPLFRYYSCVFRISQAKESTARVVMMKKMFIPFSYTIQASNGCFYDYQKHKDEPFNEYKWAEMGLKIAQCLHKYTLNIIEKQKLVFEKLKNQKTKTLQKVQKRIRKSSNIIKSKQEHLKVPKSQDVFTEIESQYQQIKQLRNLEKKKNLDRISDDQISQSSSDLQGEADDLTEEKLSLLVNILSDKKSLQSLNYNSKQIEIFLIGNKDQKKQEPIWKRQHNISKQRERLRSYSNNTNSETKKQQLKSTKFQKSIDNYHIRKEKNKNSRIISFGTGLVSFESNCLERGEIQAEKLYQNILMKQNSTFYQKTGFLPNKKREVYEKNFKRSHIVSALNSARNQEIRKINQSFGASQKKQLIARYKQKEAVNCLVNKNPQIHETFYQARSTSFVIPSLKNQRK